MVLVKTPADFVERSLLLLKANPNTTRITTSYHISPPPSADSSKKPRPKATNETSTAAPTEEKPKGPRGKLTLKTYDPISGSLIKFRTDKISDVGRMVAGLHRLGRSMAGLKDIPPAETTAATTEGATAGGAPTVSKEAVAGAVAATEGESSSAAAGGSKGGKKKNKKKK
ncbi:hypothetical protein ABW20_dc0106884 [Dactylellina cionopaga]|nr:hypothetical protein ABW20_dc0106884 [Dactylellina cionopaga]